MDDDQTEECQLLPKPKSPLIRALTWGAITAAIMGAVSCALSKFIRRNGTHPEIGNATFMEGLSAGMTDVGRNVDVGLVAGGLLGYNDAKRDAEVYPIKVENVSLKRQLKDAKSALSFAKRIDNQKARRRPDVLQKL